MQQIKTVIEICVGADETFFEQIVLVRLDEGQWLYLCRVPSLSILTSNARMVLLLHNAWKADSFQTYLGTLSSRWVSYHYPDNPEDLQGLGC